MSDTVSSIGNSIAPSFFSPMEAPTSGGVPIPVSRPSSTQMFVSNLPSYAQAAVLPFAAAGELVMSVAGNSGALKTIGQLASGGYNAGSMVSDAMALAGGLGTTYMSVEASKLAMEEAQTTIDQIMLDTEVQVGNLKAQRAQTSAESAEAALATVKRLREVNASNRARLAASGASAFTGTGGALEDVNTVDAARDLSLIKTGEQLSRSNADVAIASIRESTSNKIKSVINTGFGKALSSASSSLIRFAERGF